MSRESERTFNEERVRPEGSRRQRPTLPILSLQMPIIVFRAQLAIPCPSTPKEPPPLHRMMPFIAGRVGGVWMSVGIWGAGNRDGSTTLGGSESGLARVQVAEGIKELMDGERESHCFCSD